jgi:hypothetical protein
MTDKKVSLLINRQLPEFVREEHPKFISFLEAYYEFLDNTTYGKGRELRNISDVDFSLEEFEQQFFNSFLPFIPRETAVSKDILIKNILPLYLSKGSERSYKLLFRMLFGEDVEITYPGDQVLRASDGRWNVENILRTTIDVSSQYISDGNRTVYFLPLVLDLSEVSIYVNDSLITSGYSVLKEYRKLIFNSAPSSGSIIHIFYKNFDVGLLRSKRVTGRNTGAYSIIEKVGVRNFGGLNYYELFLNSRNTRGVFSNGEFVDTNVVIDDQNIPLSLETYSDIEKVTIVDGGSLYNVGDPVFFRGDSIKPAIAVVSKVASGTIDNLLVVRGGSGFTVDDALISLDSSANTQEFQTQEYDPDVFLAQILTVDSTGIFSSNTLIYDANIIEEFPYYNDAIEIEEFDYEESLIDYAFNPQEINDLGEITFVEVINSIISTTAKPIFDVIPTSVPVNIGSVNETFISIKNLGVIGKIRIENGGVGYEVDDELTFTNSPLYLGGQGAVARVADVNQQGTITRIFIENGGLYYNASHFPTIGVNSADGTGAVLVVDSIMGDGEFFEPIIETGRPGEIREIRILDPGISYANIPGVDLLNYGDGTALAEANIRNSLISVPGKWDGPKGIISSNEIRLQGRDYYIDYSYVLNTKVEFDRYKSILKNLLHPSGYVNYNNYKIIENLNSSILSDISSAVVKTTSGSVSVTNGSNVVVGTNTYFELAESLDIISSGSIIVINNEVVEVTSITNDTELIVSDNFTANSTNNLIKIL